MQEVQDTQVWSLGGEGSLEKGMASHSSVLAWRIPWTEEPGGLPSPGSQRVAHDWASTHSPTAQKTRLLGWPKWTLLLTSCPTEPQIMNGLCAILVLKNSKQDSKSLGWPTPFLTFLVKGLAWCFRWADIVNFHLPGKYGGGQGGVWDWQAHTTIFKADNEGFPGGLGVKNPPVSAGDLGSIPDPGRFHTLRNYRAHMSQLRSPCAPTTEAFAP